MIYLDYQATTPVDERVVEGMAPYFRERFGNAHASDHAHGWAAARALSTAKEEVAALIGANGGEIVFTSGASESNNLAILGAALSALNTRRRILVSAIEHKCVLMAAAHLRDRYGFVVDTVPVNSEGIINFPALASLMSDDVALVSIMAVNNEVGSIQPIKDIGDAARRVGAIFHCDAAQAPEAIDCSILAEWADLVSLSAHKMYGPQGLGALFVRTDLQTRIEPLIHGGGQQGGIRSGTVPLALAVGFGIAARLCMGAQAERERIRALRDDFVGRLLTIGHNVRLNGPSGGQRHPGNANLRFDGVDGRDLLGALQPMVCASTGSACSSGSPEPSHVLLAMGLSRDAAAASVRFSLGRETKPEDVSEASDHVARAVARLG